MEADRKRERKKQKIGNKQSWHDFLCKFLHLQKQLVFQGQTGNEKEIT